MVLNHAMWRDEWSVIQVGHHRSLIDMYNASSHFGHPLGWYLCAWVIDHLGMNPWGLKVFHVLISTAYIYLFVRYAPFGHLEKFLFIFGYFPFFEYGGRVRTTPRRCWGCFLRASLSPGPGDPIAFGLALALLAKTTAYGTLIGVAMGIAYLFDLWRGRSGGPDPLPWRGIAAGILIALLSMAVAYAQSRPLNDNYRTVLPRPLAPVGTLVCQGVGDIGAPTCPFLSSRFGTAIFSSCPRGSTLRWALCSSRRLSYFCFGQTLR